MFANRLSDFWWISQWIQTRPLHPYNDHCNVLANYSFDFFQLLFVQSIMPSLMGPMIKSSIFYWNGNQIVHVDLTSEGGHRKC